MSDAQIADFSNQVKDVIELYQLDGVNLWDRDSGYCRHACNKYYFLPQVD